MLHLLWGLLNLALVIGFLVLSFKATKLVRTHISNAAAVLFALGLLSFMTVSDEKREQKGHLKEDFVLIDSSYSNQKFLPPVILDNNLVSRYVLQVTYHEKTSQKVNKPTSAFAITNGLVLGTSWRPTMITFDETPVKNQYKYTVAGEREWKLLRITLLQESKIFTGIVDLP